MAALFSFRLARSESLSCFSAVNSSYSCATRLGSALLRRALQLSATSCRFSLTNLKSRAALKLGAARGAAAATGATSDATTVLRAARPRPSSRRLPGACRTNRDELLPIILAGFNSVRMPDTVTRDVQVAAGGEWAMEAPRSPHNVRHRGDAAHGAVAPGLQSASRNTEPRSGRSSSRTPAAGSDANLACAPPAPLSDPCYTPLTRPRPRPPPPPPATPRPRRRPPPPAP